MEGFVNDEPDGEGSTILKFDLHKSNFVIDWVETKKSHKFQHAERNNTMHIKSQNDNHNDTDQDANLPAQEPIPASKHSIFDRTLLGIFFMLILSICVGFLALILRQ